MNNIKDISLLYKAIEEKLNKVLLIEKTEDIPILPPGNTISPIVDPVLPPVTDKIVNPAYNIFYQTMHEDKEGEIGIYLYESANDVTDLSGEEVFNNIKVQVQVNCYKTETGLMEGLNLLSSFVETIESELSDVKGIEFIAVQHVGPRACPIGKNSYNILIVKSILDIKYIFE